MATPGLYASAADDGVGYLTTTDGRVVVDAESDCVHTGEWVPGMHYRRCNAPQPHAASAATVAAHAEAPVKPRPPTPSQVRLAPVPFRLSIDTLFDFDRATLKPQGEALLDKVADRIARADFRSIDIVGHTDRIGSDSYNRLLSERRAQAVRAYLVERGLDSKRLSARGVGSSEPVTVQSECAGRRGTRLIQCLQPDRYAELKVSGTTPDATASRGIMDLESAQPAA
jgi:OOP family OmpA-OmpF porin